MFKSSLVFPGRDGSLRWSLQERLLVVSLACRDKHKVYACLPSENRKLSLGSVSRLVFSAFDIFVSVPDMGKNLTSPWSWCLTHGVDDVHAVSGRSCLDGRETQGDSPEGFVSGCMEQPGETAAL